MAISASSSAQRARQALADRLAELCRDAGLTGADLAGRCGWSRSKSSRIMNARTAPSAEDIRVWCEVCGVQDQTEDLIASLRTAEGFWIFDVAQVNVELISGYLTITHPREVAAYAQAFAELAELAVHGASARALIDKARDSLG
ncbi:helix-turn-helix domain-containing protein [Streptomyces albidoflavus]|uniref:helix-turn-helix domain-containing protein n=1 Tax=Streptomyces albidoflavus TaxID=1886 RepID=UPI000525E291|nr:helix-turn-helix transcriptional regulator [Streptomyces albidoflavus]